MKPLLGIAVAIVASMAQTREPATGATRIATPEMLPTVVTQVVPPVVATATSAARRWTIRPALDRRTNPVAGDYSNV